MTLEIVIVHTLSTTWTIDFSCFYFDVIKCIIILPIIIIICLSLLLFTEIIDCILFMRIDYYCILSIKFEILSFICLNKIKQAF